MNLSKILCSTHENDQPVRGLNMCHDNGEDVQKVVAILSNFQRDTIAQAQTRHDKEERALDLSRLDLLFEADAMLQQQIATPSTTKRKHTTKQPVLSPASSPGDKQPSYLRSGMWSAAEEEYASALIFYFVNGHLPIREGTTLRKYLAEQLCCNRRRISMKLATGMIAGHAIPRKVGASVFTSSPSSANQEEMMLILHHLRRANFQELEQSQYPFRRGSPVEDTRSYNEHKRSKGLDLSPTPEATSSSPTISRNQSPSRRPQIIRTGFTNVEEEEYVKAMIESFLTGMLDLPHKTRLVQYLCDQLECSFKQLSFKLAPRKSGECFVPENVGTIVYRSIGSSEQVFEAEANVYELRQAWLQTREEQGSPLKRMRRERFPSTENTKPWSQQEETFAASLIDAFFRGDVNLAEGTTLCEFLSSQLQCNDAHVKRQLANGMIAGTKLPKYVELATYVRRCPQADPYYTTIGYNHQSSRDERDSHTYYPPNEYHNSQQWAIHDRFDMGRGYSNRHYPPHYSSTLGQHRPRLLPSVYRPSFPYQESYPAYSLST